MSAPRLGADDPLAEAVGPQLAATLAKVFGMRTVRDLVEHLPRRHASRGELTEIAGLEADEHVTLVAEVVSVGSRPMQRRRGSIVTAEITDGRGRLQLTWFNQPYRATQLRAGARGLFSGKVSLYGGRPQLAHPDCKLFDDDEDVEATALEWATRPLPIYPASEKVPSWRLAEIIEGVLDRVPRLADPVPSRIRAARGDLDYDTAVRRLHRPVDEHDLEPARETLKFTEALLLQTALAQQRARLARRTAVGYPLAPGGALERFDAGLPYTLTGDQRAVGEALSAELAGTAPMHRLLQGEVGSGKTLVALRAMLQVADWGAQSALLAPTEVLAAQHLRSIVELLGPELEARLAPVLLTGSQTKRERQEALLGVVTGQSKLVIGTHALLGDKVEFADLGLVIVDEQHRFGVDQREALRQKGQAPHVLAMTATPIPRTVALTAFGDLEVSTLRELPAGRAGIESFVVATADHPQWISRVWQRTAEELARGRQAFVVCPAIAPGEPEGAEQPDGDAADEQRPLLNVAETVEHLRALPEFAGRRIEPLHGAMSADEKDSTMRAFAVGDIEILVSTTVIEVGVDVPNASVMIVLDADRFGVSQLHQLRGRVGRGRWPGIALLVTASSAMSLARERVEAVAATLDGFELAERDLELRREGDVLGTAQSGGRSSLKLLRVVADRELIEEARAIAAELVAADPELAAEPALRAALDRLDGGTRDRLGMG